MSTTRKMCFDKILQTDLYRPRRLLSISGRVRAIAPRDKRWVNGSSITIRFLDGNALQRDMVKRIAPEWTRYANLDFVFTDDPMAQIRVSFDETDGAWSYIGTDNLHIPRNTSTLNLGWQDEGVILHEFGHMIGLAHEHQSPLGGMQWNEEVVIRELGGPPNYWDEATVRHNVLKKYSVDQVFGTEFDPNSIMLYSFPAEWTLNGVATHENQSLSDLDKQFVKSAKMYPRKDSPDVVAQEIKLDQMIQEQVNFAGEQDLYRFTASTDSTYRVETFGSTDTVIALYGPDNVSRLIAEDDDNGSRRNALIQAHLEPGTYFIQVRHYNEHLTGQYRIMVSH